MQTILPTRFFWVLLGCVLCVTDLSNLALLLVTFRAVKNNVVFPHFAAKRETCPSEIIITFNKKRLRIDLYSIIRIIRHA